MSEFGKHKAVLFGRLVTTAQQKTKGSCYGCVFNNSAAAGSCMPSLQLASGFNTCSVGDGHIYVEAMPDEPKVEQADPYAHYFKSVRHLDTLDVYRVLELFEVTDPCIQHAVKKLLCAGSRGQKDMAKDITEASDSLARWHEMREEDAQKEKK
jgi:hypothetical protein